MSSCSPWRRVPGRSPDSGSASRPRRDSRWRGSRRVVPVSALEALARAAVNDNDADRGVDGCASRAKYSRSCCTADGRAVLVPAESSLPDAILDRVGLGGAHRPPVFIGDGAIRYRAEILARFGDAARVIDPPPLAGSSDRSRPRIPERAVLPHAVVPDLYPEAGRRTGAARASRRRLSAMERPMWSWSISRLASEAELDRVVALEAASFSNPWTRDMLARELRTPM